CGRGRHDAAPPGSSSPSNPATAPGAASKPAESEEPATASHATSRPPAFEERSDERGALSDLLAEDGIKDRAVLRAIRTVPRHAFVLPALQQLAYSDRPLPIVGGQTISQPYIVAFMTEAGKPTPESKCFEIGTGSGYQAAVLAEICKHTYSIE